jgi:hypothetical protein
MLFAVGHLSSTFSTLVLQKVEVVELLNAAIAGFWMVYFFGSTFTVFRFYVGRPLL